MATNIYYGDIELAQKSEVNSALSGKQDTLVSQQNIKSINGQSLLGEGNIQISSGDGVAVLEFGGYVDADTLESHLTLTKEEFLKGIDNEVAFAKVELDTNEGGTLVKVIDLYLTKLTGEYVEGQNGQLMFSSSFDMGGGPQLATLSVVMDDSITPESWDIDFDAQELGGGGTDDYDDLNHKPITNQTESGGGVYTPSPVDGEIYRRDTNLYKYSSKTKLQPFTIGQTIENGDKIHFDTSKEADMVAFFKEFVPLDSRKEILKCQNGTWTILSVIHYQNDVLRIVANENYNDTTIYLSDDYNSETAGWHNLDANNDYTISLYWSTTIDTINDYVPNEWNGEFIGGQPQTINKFAKLITEDENIIILDASVVGNIDYNNSFAISQETYEKLKNNGNIIIKCLIGNYRYYFYKAMQIPSNDGTNYWDDLYFISSLNNSNPQLKYVIDITYSQSTGYYGTCTEQGTYFSMNEIPDWGLSAFSTTAVRQDNTPYLIKEAVYTHDTPVASGDVIQGQVYFTNAFEYNYPINVNGKKYNFVKQEQNASYQNIDTYASIDVNGSFIHISILEYNEGTYTITFKEQDVNGGVAYTTTPPSSDNLDGDLKFVVLTSTQAQGITKYNGYLYYII